MEEALYRMFQKESAIFREKVSQVKSHRYHQNLKLYGENGKIILTNKNSNTFIDQEIHIKTRRNFVVSVMLTAVFNN